MNLELSSKVKDRKLKILLWGPTASRKTETGLRYFPNCLIVDTEGNTDQCIGMPEIPEFLRLQTKDVYEVLELMDALAQGKVKFPDGRPVETLIIDSASVLWSVRQEVGALLAEKRVARKTRQEVNPDEVNMTMAEWTVAKRPLKQLLTRINNAPVKYVILTAREQDLYEMQGDVPKKVGTTPDLMRGVEYEVNVAFQMFNSNPWKCRVTKVQGALGKLLPLHSEHREFPHEILLEYATGAGSSIQDEVEVAEKNAEREQTRTKADLVKVGEELGLSAEQIAEALKKAGLKFDPAKWDEMVGALELHKERCRQGNGGSN